jgi:hypothetical protein
MFFHVFSNNREDAMKTRLISRTIRGTFFIFILVMVSISCDLTGLHTPQQSAEPEATLTLPTGTAELENTIINGPGGMILTLEGEALSDASNVKLEVLGEGSLSWEQTPFESASPQYLVDFGSAEQTSGITLTVPLSQSISPISLGASAGPYNYAAWVQPDTGSPSLVGVLVDQDQANFPIVGAGKYQLLKILAYQSLAEIVDVKEPLSVPSYPQMTSSWCSPTALTDLAGYHVGAWPAGGRGSIWGESSNWYLAGEAGQPYNKGYFFHWLLAAGGYTVPSDVRESFVNGNAQVYIWNWNAARINLNYYEFDYERSMYEMAGQNYVAAKLEYAISLFYVFRAYVESNVWGVDGVRRPVAWGSSLAGHSRTITGSDGINLFYNDPGSGAWNQSKSWTDYFQEIIASLTSDEQEVIDTVVFIADPRPADERRLVLWLLPWTESQEGSIILRRGAAGTPAAYWRWDGDLGHMYGYYYQDLVGDLPLDTTFDAKFLVTTVQDAVEYGFVVRSISDNSYDFRVQTELYGVRSGDLPLYSSDTAATVAGGQKVNFFPAGSFPLIDLDSEMNYLKFTLWQGSIVQDVKYVYFDLAPITVFRPNIGLVTAQAYCREGPGTNYAIVTGFEPSQNLTLVGLNPEQTWGKFEAVEGDFRYQCWVGLNLVEIPGGMDVPILTPPLTPTTLTTPTTSACFQYTTPLTCAQHSECTWNRLAATAVCQPK